MNIPARITDERVADVRCDADSLIVDLMDGRTITVLAWYPRLLAGAASQLGNRTGRLRHRKSTVDVVRQL